MDDVSERGKKLSFKLRVHHRCSSNFQISASSSQGVGFWRVSGESASFTPILAKKDQFLKISGLCLRFSAGLEEAGSHVIPVDPGAREDGGGGPGLSESTRPSTASV